MTSRNRRHRSRTVCLCATLAATLLSHSAVAPDNRGLVAIRERMQGFVDDGTVAGAVTFVAHHGRTVSLEAVGFADLAHQQPMRTDSLFWIASMTKPITAAAVLLLQDQGRLRVEDPVERYLPEFRHLWMVSEKGDSRQVLVPSPRPVTIRDLLTHTSGLGDVATPRFNSSLAELVMAYSQQPLHFPPGSRWEYCNAGINTLGRIVEVVSGEPYAQFIQQHILEPLRMKDSTFWPTKAQLKRLAKAYQPGKDNQRLAEVAIYFLKGALSDRRRTAFPAGGLFSTAQDIARFYQMALNGGTLDRRRILSAEAIGQMTHTQTDDIKTGFTDGMSWGLGFQVIKEPQGVTGMLSPGTFGHGGAYATQSWADPKQDLILVLMIQRAGFPNGDNSPVRRAFQEAAVAGVSAKPF